ncbi:MAG: MarR family transcriptional regulator [Opitutaceae bacterium]|nr:MarR family transcriptional regulator [Verrucomicrobiales bacterium]
MPRLPKRITALPVDDPARRRLPILLRRAWYGLNQAFRRRIAHTGVTPDQFTALRTLTECDPVGLPQSELTRLMASDPNTIASLVERMKTAGFVDRQTHERDRRAYRIKIKPLGRRKYEEVREIAISLQTEILSSLPLDRQENFLEELAQVADASQATADNTPRK